MQTLPIFATKTTICKGGSTIWHQYCRTDNLAPTTKEKMKPNYKLTSFFPFKKSQTDTKTPNDL